MLDVVLGIVGAVLAGGFFRAIGIAGVGGLTIGSLAVAAIGAVMLLGILHMIKGAVIRA